MLRPFKFASIITGCCAILLSLLSCKNEPATLTTDKVILVKQGVDQMMNGIAKDLSTEGPGAWQKYFEEIPEFFMASDGELILPSGDSAKQFIIHTLSKQVRKIELKWESIRIDPITVNFALVGAEWHEQVINFSDSTILYGGYFTAAAEKSVGGWRFRNAHWSNKKGK